MSSDVWTVGLAQNLCVFSQKVRSRRKQGSEENREVKSVGTRKKREVTRKGSEEIGKCRLKKVEVKRKEK